MYFVFNRIHDVFWYFHYSYFRFRIFVFGISRFLFFRISRFLFFRISDFVFLENRFLFVVFSPSGIWVFFGFGISFLIEFVMHFLKIK